MKRSQYYAEGVFLLGLCYGVGVGVGRLFVSNFTLSAMKGRCSFFVSLLGCLALSFVTSSAFGMYAKLTDEELIARSDLIVHGEYVGEREIAFSWGAEVRVGVIEVKRVVKGSGAMEEVYVLVPSVGGPIASDQMRFEKGQSGLWLLKEMKPERNGLYQVETPQMFLSESNAKEIERLEAVAKGKR